MLSLFDRTSIEDALSQPIDPKLRGLMATSIVQAIGGASYDLADFTHILIVRQGDPEDAIRREIGFSPLENWFDRARFGSSAFKPFWDQLIDHGGWFELVFTVGNGGFAYVLFVEDAEGVDPGLLALCRAAPRRRG